jgi:hypothetical protein
MKKILFILVAALVTFSAAAQKMKLKKGEIQLDGVSVAKVEKEKGMLASACHFSDLNGTLLFTADLLTKTPAGNSLDFTVLTLTAPNGNVKEFDTRKINTGFSLSTTTIICDYVLHCGANLITPAGVDLQQVNDYFQTADRSITVAIDEKMQLLLEEITKEDKMAAADGLKIDSDKTIRKGTATIGRIEMRKVAKDGKYKYVIMDKNLEFVGGVSIPIPASEVSYKPTLAIYSLTTFDRQELPFYATFNPLKASSVDDVANRLLKKLYYSGYRLDEMTVKEMGNVSIEKAKANSKKNIYDVQGYIIDKDGNRNEGLVTIEYESLDELMGKTGGNIADITNYGGSARLKTAEGKTKPSNAKDKITVVAGDRKFVGLPSAVLLDGAKLYEVFAEKEGNTVLYLVTYDEYFLKLANQEKAKRFTSQNSFGNKKSEKLEKEFAEYMQCPALNFEDYDYSTLTTFEGLQKLLDDYAAKCK